MARVTQRVNVKRAKSTNYTPMGAWDSSIQYRLSDMGIPLVTLEKNTVTGFAAYGLNVDKSTIGVSPDSTAGAQEWRLLESTDFLYMVQAYIEKLQAQVITAEYIESLMIRTANIEILEGAVIKGNLQGVKGSFKSLQALDAGGNVAGELTFSSDGKMLFTGGDMQHQGTKDGRALRFLTNDLYCRGIFSHYKKLTGSYTNTLNGTTELNWTVGVMPMDFGATVDDQPVVPGQAFDIYNISSKSRVIVVTLANSSHGKEITITNTGDAVVYVNKGDGTRSTVLQGRAVTFTAIHKSYTHGGGSGTLWLPH